MNGRDASHQLYPVTGRPSLPVYSRQLWDRRHFIRAEAQAKAYSGTRSMLLGRAWLLLSPLLDAAVYGVIFGLLLKTSRGVEHFIPFLFVGITFFSFTSRAFNGGSGLMRVRRNVVKAFAFPRAAVVLSHMLKFLYDTLPVLVMTLLVVTLFPQGIGYPKVTWLLLPLVFFLQLLFNTGLMFFSAAMTHFIPDLKNLFTYGTRLVFYGSGIFYSIDHLNIDNPLLDTILKNNPMHVLLTIARDILIYGQIPSFSMWGTFALWSITTLIVGFILFWSKELSYAKG